jgi:electron transport complex protein RnfB
MRNADGGGVLSFVPTTQRRDKRMPTVPTTSAKAARQDKKKGEKAWIETDYCSGCEACVDICPVGCILTVQRPIAPPWYNEKVCVIDVTRCTGCRLCWEICPWDCIVMVDQDEIEEVLPLAQTQRARQVAETVVAGETVS